MKSFKQFVTESDPEFEAWKKSFKERLDKYHNSKNTWKHERIEKELGPKHAENVYNYVWTPHRTPEMHASIEHVITHSPPHPEAHTSFRGLHLPEHHMKALHKNFNKGKVTHWELHSPPSFTNDQSIAYMFASRKFHSRINTQSKPEKGHVPVIIKAHIPAGHKVAHLPHAFGVGREHVISKNIKLRIKSIKRNKTHYFVKVHAE